MHWESQKVEEYGAIFMLKKKKSDYLGNWDKEVILPASGESGLVSNWG